MLFRHFTKGPSRGLGNWNRQLQRINHTKYYTDVRHENSWISKQKFARSSWRRHCSGEQVTSNAMVLPCRTHAYSTQITCNCTNNSGIPVKCKVCNADSHQQERKGEERREEAVMGGSWKKTVRWSLVRVETIVTCERRESQLASLLTCHFICFCLGFY